MALTKEMRDGLPANDFAVPSKRVMPIHDERHVRLAWDMVDRTKDLTDEDRADARLRILARASDLSIDTANWNRLKAMAWELDSLSAMSLAVPETPDHPNKLPFSGVLTFVDQPSNAPPGGSGGKLVVLTRAAAEKALPTLLGMAIDYTPGLDGHDPTAKIGIIESATIEGNAIKIGGFFYAHDFPDEVKAIRLHKDLLGFSFEAERIRVADMTAKVLEVVELCFTGAAVLQKDKAAYTKTSLAASSAAQEQIPMDKIEEILASIQKLSEGLATVTKTVDGLAASAAKNTSLSAGDLSAKMKPHADRLNAAADAMEADGVGGHAQHGHPAVLRRMSSSLMANAAMGRVPHTCDEAYRAASDTSPAAIAAAAESTKAVDEVKGTLKTLAASLESLGTSVKDLQAKSINVGGPDRKTLPPRITSLLAKGGVTLPEDGKTMTVAGLDAALKSTSLNAQQRIELKIGLNRAGILAA